MEPASNALVGCAGGGSETAAVHWRSSYRLGGGGAGRGHRLRRRARHSGWTDRGGVRCWEPRDHASAARVPVVVPGTGRPRRQIIPGRSSRAATGACGQGLGGGGVPAHGPVRAALMDGWASTSRSESRHRERCLRLRDGLRGRFPGFLEAFRVSYGPRDRLRAPSGGSRGVRVGGKRPDGRECRRRQGVKGVGRPRRPRGWRSRGRGACPRRPGGRCAGGVRGAAFRRHPQCWLSHA